MCFSRVAEVSIQSVYCRLVGRLVSRFVCRSVQRLYCDKTADWIWMPFGVVSGVGRGMGVLDDVHIFKGKEKLLVFPHWFEWRF